MAAPWTIEHCCFLEVGAGEFEEKPVERSEEESAPREIDELLLEVGDDVLHLGLSWDEGRTGAPRRHPRPRALTLVLGKTARLVINGRHSSWEQQWYSQRTFNVALMENVPQNVFVSRTPDKVFSQEADLF